MALLRLKKRMAGINIVNILLSDIKLNYCNSMILKNDLRSV